MLKNDLPAWPYARGWKIALRTAHICVTGILVGGHVFGIGSGRLSPFLLLTLLTGVALMTVEAYPSWRYILEGRGIAVLAKLLLLGLIPWAWSMRVSILVMVVVIGSVGSHMPWQYRHYSPAPRQVIKKTED
jgi:hypothetical protein